MSQPTRTDMQPEDQLKSLLEKIVTSISRHTPSPGIEHFFGNTFHTLVLSVDGRDQGRLIGKKGSVIWALQTILWYAGLTVIRHPCRIKLLEPKNPQRDLPPAPFKFNPEWDRTKILGLASSIISSCMPHHATVDMAEIDDTSAIVTLKVEAYLKTPISEPSFTDAFETILRSAGMCNGAQIKTEIKFT